MRGKREGVSTVKLLLKLEQIGHLIELYQELLEQYSPFSPDLYKTWDASAESLRLLERLFHSALKPGPMMALLAPELADARQELSATEMRLRLVESIPKKIDDVKSMIDELARTRAEREKAVEAQANELLHQLAQSRSLDLLALGGIHYPYALYQSLYPERKHIRELASDIGRFIDWELNSALSARRRLVQDLDDAAVEGLTAKQLARLQRDNRIRALADELPQEKRKKFSPAEILRIAEQDPVIQDCAGRGAKITRDIVREALKPRSRAGKKLR